MKNPEVLELPLNDERLPDKEFYGLINKWLIEKAGQKEGCICPLCKKRVKIQPRTITVSMAKTLLYLYRHFYKYPDSKPVHVDSFISAIAGRNRPKGNNHSLLVHWRLLEKCEDGRKGRGYYRITDTGRLFVNGILKVQKYILTFNNKCWGFKGDEVTIQDCLKQKFDLQEFLGRDIHCLI